MALQVQQDFWGTLSVVALSIVGVASLAVLVSRQSNSVGVINASSNAFTGALGVALSPVTAGGYGSVYPIG